MYELDFDSVCIILWDQLSTRVAFLLTYARLPRVRGTIIGLLLSLLVDGQLVMVAVQASDSDAITAGRFEMRERHLLFLNDLWTSNRLL